MILPTINCSFVGPSEVAVIYLPFQLPRIDLYETLLREILSKHTYVVFALPISKVSPTKHCPLSFSMREQMIRSSLSQYVNIVAVPNEKYFENQVKALHTAVENIWLTRQIHLYTDTAFLEAYNGSWIVSKIQIDERPIQNLIGKQLLLDIKDPQEAFRTGIIHAMNSQWPINWLTVDMAIIRRVDKKVQVLLGKKPGEKKWRFVGGFKDRKDATIEDAVLREGGEEALISGINPRDVFKTPTYISSRNVNDWRYRNELDGITTVFYQVEFIGTEDQLKAGDDIEEIHWFGIDILHDYDFEGEHSLLFQDLKTII